MVFGIVFFALLAVAVIYYVYRQFTDPGLSLFPNNQPPDPKKQSNESSSI